MKPFPWQKAEQPAPLAPPASTPPAQVIVPGQLTGGRLEQSVHGAVNARGRLNNLLAQVITGQPLQGQAPVTQQTAPHPRQEGPVAIPNHLFYQQGYPDGHAGRPRNPMSAPGTDNFVQYDLGYQAGSQAAGQGGSTSHGADVDDDENWEAQLQRPDPDETGLFGGPPTP